MRDASTQHVAGVASAVGVERRRLARAERVHTLRIRRYLDLLGDKTEAGVGDGDEERSPLTAGRASGCYCHQRG